jgi:poly(hydroxyalkanoate) depolymerase family esterase
MNFPLKKTLFTIVALMLSLFLAGQNELEEIKDFGSNPGKLDMFLHKPHQRTDTIRHKARRPLVVVLHGCNQSAKSLSRESGWDMLADKFDFYVIYPAQSRLNNASNCFDWYNEKDISKNSGESGSVKQMIDYMRRSYGIDSTQIFVYGLSAGAAMTTALLANYPETFNAGAVLAGGPYKMATGAWDGLSAMMKPTSHTAKEWGALVKKDNPDFKGNYPRLVICHGKDDKIVNPKNSYELVKQWSDLTGTDTVACKTEKNFAGRPDIEKNIYCSKDGSEKIFYYQMAGLGHALAVDPGTGATQGGQKGIFTVDRDFFSTYWIAKDFGLIP